MDRKRLRRALGVTPQGKKTDFSRIFQKLVMLDSSDSVNDGIGLEYEEKVFILSAAIHLAKYHEFDQEQKFVLELAYYIILKYSIVYNDYLPLYDFSINFGFYPIAKFIDEHIYSYVDLENSPRNQTIQEYLQIIRIEENYKYQNIIETYEQKKSRESLLKDTTQIQSYVAPTSYGKSNNIFEHIKSHLEIVSHLAIIVPTKSLLNQTFQNVKSNNFGYKIMIHDDMFRNDLKTISVLTQERALRLLEKNPEFSFDILYIDEAHNLFNGDMRNILLSRLILMNKKRNMGQKVLYLSPLINDSDNLLLQMETSLTEQRIEFNIKEPEVYEYRLIGEVFKYCRFVDEFFKIDQSDSVFAYIEEKATQKNFCFLNSPKKIEKFALSLTKKLSEKNLNFDTIKLLEKYVHKDFQMIDCLSKGIIYLHGKLPDNIKEFLEYKFSKEENIQYLVANTVVLEGMNMPIDSLFILHTTGITNKNLINLIGRVNRLNNIFDSEKGNIKKLIPPIHFVNSKEFHHKKNKMESAIKKLFKKDSDEDILKNPLLVNYNLENLPYSEEKKKTVQEKNDRILKEEYFILKSGHEDSEEKKLKRRLIELGLSSIYNISEELCQVILQRMSQIEIIEEYDVNLLMDAIFTCFAQDMTNFIIDDEFKRLTEQDTITFYKMYLENYSTASLSEKIGRQTRFFIQRKNSSNKLYYMGISYGEEPAYRGLKPVYVNLRSKTNKDIVNLAIVKIAMEDDFVSYKLTPLCVLLLEHKIISESVYNQFIYGSNDTKDLELIKLGLNVNLVKLLKEAGQLGNIYTDRAGNLYGNKDLQSYVNTLDEFARFHILRILSIAEND